MDEIQAAFLNVKLRYLEGETQGRREIAAYYIANIENSNIILPSLDQVDGHVWHVFVIRSNKRDELQTYLQEHGIQTLIHYPIPLYKQECYSYMSDISLPITEQIHEEVLSLPISAVIDNDEILKVVSVLNAFNG
jgi:dTDP-4-amino-4,6-dideoxygalactose transaminase